MSISLHSLHYCIGNMQAPFLLTKTSSIYSEIGYFSCSLDNFLAKHNFIFGFLCLTSLVRMDHVLGSLHLPFLQWNNFQLGSLHHLFLLRQETGSSLPCHLYPYNGNIPGDCFRFHALLSALISLSRMTSKAFHHFPSSHTNTSLSLPALHF